MQEHDMHDLHFELQAMRNVQGEYCQAVLTLHYGLCLACSHT